MDKITDSSLSDEAHRAAPARAELGTLLTAIGRRARLTDEEFAAFAERDATPARPLDLE